MKFTKKELKKIILEEYQKVLKEYIAEGGEAGHYTKMRSQEKPTPDPFALRYIDFIREKLANVEGVPPEVGELLTTLEQTLGAASPEGDESSPHPGGEPDAYPPLEEVSH